MPMHPHVKFSHSLTLDSGHIWTLLGTFSWVHNNSRARLVIVTPKKISFPGFFVWLSKVIIPTRHWRNRAFLSLWNTNFISIRQAVHNAPIHFTQMVDIMVIYTNALTWIILMGSANEGRCYLFSLAERMPRLIPARSHCVFWWSVFVHACHWKLCESGEIISGWQWRHSYNDVTIRACVTIPQ